MNDNDKRLWWEAYTAALTGFSGQSESSSAGIDLWARSQADLALKAFHARWLDDSAFDAPWTGLARVDLLGHRSYLGRIREIDRYGSRLGEVQELLASGEYGNTHLFGGKIVYTVSSVSLETALTEVRATRKFIQCAECHTFICDATWEHPLYNDTRPLCDGCKEEAAARCPTCDSPSPRLHPAMQHEGEVEMCKDAFHVAAQAEGNAF